MLNEAIKRQLLSSAGTFKAGRWEGKSLGFKLKYAIANHPEMTLGCFFFGIVLPVIATYRTMTYDSTKNKALEKYRMYFTIVRDDHPNLEKIKEEKEWGREFFPKC